MSDAKPRRSSRSRSKAQAEAGDAPQLSFGERWVYDAAPESQDHLEIRDRYDLFLGGRWLPARGRKSFVTSNPATSAELARVALAGPADVDAAVTQARKAQAEVWGPMPAADRGRYLFRIARLIQERARELAVLETLDGGKPIRETRDVDVPLAAQWFFYHAGWADKIGLAFPGRDPQPKGVVGQIIPWNFPLLMAAWKLAPALACGNTVVLKPAETSPLTALHLAQICEQAELPPGVVNIVTGDGRTGAALVKHPGLDKLAFTGSTAVGKEIQATLSGSGVDLTLELGGKAAHIVFEDAALDQAVEGVVRGIFFNQGHVCCAGSRLLLQESIAEAFVSKLKRRMERIRVGDPMDKNTDMGAIHSPEQLQRIERLVAQGVSEGGELHQASCQLPRQGNWFKPSLFTGVSLSDTVCREEIFGPVLSLLTFRTAEEAVAKANNTEYGLSAGIWTDKGARILWLADRLRAGVVWNNTYNRFDPASPFGGYQESGFGREGGRQGLAAYLDFRDDLLTQG